jgi:transposase
LTGIPIAGVGEVTAWAILAYLPEITQLSRNRIVAMAGLAPFDKDSGASKGQRHICGGRHKVRNVLYMAAMTAARHNPHIKDYVERSMERGKAKKWAYIAAIRKILIHLQRTLTDQNICLVS